jgi:hypothetical protein
MNFTEENNTGKKRLYQIRQSYTDSAKHTNDVYLNLGYSYNGNILANGTSDEIWANPQQISSIKRLEGILVFLIETSKNIKKHFSIAHDKNMTNIS